MILPFSQAKAVARGRTQVLYLPVARIARPKIGHREPIQSRHDDGRVTHCHVHIGMWEITTLRGLLKPEAVKDRQQAGWRLGDGIAQMCDEWMRRYDKGWPRLYADPCGACEQTGIATPDEPCKNCSGAGWLYTEQEATERQVVERFEKRHADRPVYAVIVTVDRVEPLRIPTPAGRPRGDELGYSANPSDDVLEIGEAVPVGYQELLSKEARKRDDEARKERGEGKDMRSRKRQQDRYKRVA